MFGQWETPAGAALREAVGMVGAQQVAEMLHQLGATIPPAPVVQQQSFLQFVPTAATPVITNEATASVTYADLATSGPSVSGLPDGHYLVLFGAAIDPSVADYGFMSISANGSSPSDNDAAVSIANAAASRATITTLTAHGNNTVKAMYRTNSGTSAFAYRWLVVIKYSNL